jgi:hypothetical protein
MTWVAGLIATGEVKCDGCEKIMRHPDRYAYISEEGQPPLRLCEKCSDARGHMRKRKDEKGRESASFL